MNDLALLAVAAFCLLIAGAALHRLISRAERLNAHEDRLIRDALRIQRERLSRDPGDTP